MRSKVAILYISTGPYSAFFEDFYDSCNKHFLTDFEKTYFVFSNKNKDHFDYDNVKLIQVDHSPWPLNTLLRYHYFSTIKYDLANFDYIFFFNANALFIKDFGSELLPTVENNYLLSVPHPAFVNKINLIKPWERRPWIKCSIPFSYSGTYYQGGFNGGKANQYLELIEWCKNAITNDLKNNRIAVWHDESYLNKYFTTVKPRLLSVDYIWPENFGVNHNAVLIMRDKNKLEWYSEIK